MADYISQYTGGQIDSAVGRALPGGAIDQDLADRLSTSGGTITGLLEFVRDSGGYALIDAVSNGVDIHSARSKQDSTGRTFVSIKNGEAADYPELKDALALTRYDTYWTRYRIYGEHSLPTGVYTGTATLPIEVSIPNHGIPFPNANTICISADDAIAFVTRTGGIGVYNGTVQTLTNNEAYFTNGGKLVINTTKACVNTNGAYHFWEVL